MTKPSTLLVLKMTAISSIREMLYLPLWWYTRGARETLGMLWRSVGGSVLYFGVEVWAKNLFVPMYGDTSVIGRAISFGVRLVVVLVRSLGVVAWAVAAIGLAMLYLMILPVLLFGILSQLVGMLM